MHWNRRRFLAGTIKSLAAAVPSSGLFAACEDRSQIGKRPDAVSGFAGPPVPAASFLDSLGINIHLTYHDTPYGDFGLVERSLKFLGLRHLRDHVSTQQVVQQRLEALGHQGYRFNFMASGHDPLHWQLEEIDRLADFVESVEGPNETDIWPVKHGGLEGFDATRRMVQDLYAAVNSNHTLRARDVKVIQTSFGRAISYREFGVLDRFADYGNAHVYFEGGRAPGATIADRIREAQRVSPNLPVIATEGGYHTAIAHQSDNSGVSENVHAKYVLRFFLMTFLNSISRSYLYELFDIRSDPAKSNPSSNYGLFRIDGSPKPAAIAVSNMVRLLQGCARLPSIRPLEVDIPAMPGNVFLLTLQKAPGRYLLVAWKEVDGWNPKVRTEIAVATDRMEIKFFKDIASVEICDPVVSNMPLQRHSSVRTIHLSVGDSPVFLDIQTTEADGPLMGGP